MSYFWPLPLIYTIFVVFTNLKIHYENDILNVTFSPISIGSVVGVVVLWIVLELLVIVYTTERGKEAI